MGQARRAVVLLLHGSRDAAWIEPFEEMRADIAARLPGVRVATACLQICPPTLDDTIGVLAGEGIGNVVVVPVFISTRGHVARDVPVLVEKARKRYPKMEISVSRAVGELPGVRESMINGIVAAGEK
ncbi:MAG: cobalamin biosynthesis protein CbiX [Verrucomicrobia bacterium]|nr:cobalamin biosynthesis protein CbiX [Verrucomicrobiota bacterium]